MLKDVHTTAALNRASRCTATRRLETRNIHRAVSRLCCDYKHRRCFIQMVRTIKTMFSQYPLLLKSKSHVAHFDTNNIVDNNCYFWISTALQTIFAFSTTTPIKINRGTERYFSFHQAALSCSDGLEDRI